MHETSTLIVMVGLPRAGKTTWARQQGHPIVSADAIRLALHGQRFLAQAEKMVWATAHLMVRALLFAGHTTVIVDGTHVTLKRRAEWVDAFWSPYCEVAFKVIGTPPAVCTDRAMADGDTETLLIINRMAEAWDVAGFWKTDGPFNELGGHAI